MLIHDDLYHLNKWGKEDKIKSFTAVILQFIYCCIRFCCCRCFRFGIFDFIHCQSSNLYMLTFSYTPNAHLFSNLIYSFKIRQELEKRKLSFDFEKRNFNRNGWTREVEKLHSRFFSYFQIYLYNLSLSFYSPCCVNKYKLCIA